MAQKPSFWISYEPNPYNYMGRYVRTLYVHLPAGLVLVLPSPVAELTQMSIRQFSFEMSSFLVFAAIAILEHLKTIFMTSILREFAVVSLVRSL